MELYIKWKSLAQQQVYYDEIESKAQSQIFQAFPNNLPNWEANVQVETFSKVENLQYVSCITAEKEHHKKRVDK